MPLTAALSEVRTLDPPPPTHHLRDFALDGIGIAHHLFNDWYRDVWWGFIVARLLAVSLKDGNRDAVLEIVDGRPSILPSSCVFAGAHVGPSRVSRLVLSQHKKQLFSLATSKPVGSEEVHDVNTPYGRITGATSVLAALEGGRDVYFALDGRFGGESYWLSFLGRRVEVRSLVPALAAQVSVPTRLTLALWVGDRLRFTDVAMPEIEDASDRDAITVWYQTAFRHLEEACRTNPANISMRGGFWKPLPGGVFGT